MRQLLQNQTIDQAAVNKAEHHVLSVVRTHVTTAWQRVLGTIPSEVEIRQLLSLIRVQVLDLKSDSSGEREAKTRLCTAVLRDPDHVNAAWASIIDFCSNLAAQQSGTDRLGIQRALQESGLELKAPKSYQHDIERLRKYSSSTLGALTHFSQIHVGTTKIKIHRACSESLRKSAEHDSMLVLGEPGAGKSGVLHDLVEELSSENRDCVFLAVDRIAASSLGGFRLEMGLDHDLIEVLDNWPGVQPGYIVIDALDAARGEAAQRMIQDIIRCIIEKNGRWRVVASIRKFDLRYGVEIKRLFSGQPPTDFQDDEFKSIRHLNVMPLSEEELSQISSQYPELAELIREAHAELRDLLRVLFNLRLMAEMLGDGVEARELSTIKTHFELLNRYWLKRIIGEDKQDDAREGVLRKACEEMLKARNLYFERSAVADAQNSDHLNYLLSNQVLEEWKPSPDARPDRTVLAFSHHVLFDFAVAKLLLGGTPEAFNKRLVSDPDLVLFVMPSLMIHFQHLWTIDSNRSHLWDIIFRVIRTDGIPEIGKLIGPTVAAGLAREMQDLEPLCDALDDFSSENHSAAEDALRHLVGALLAGDSGKLALIGPVAGPWCQFLERISKNLKLSIAYPVRSLLSTICEHPEDFIPDQRMAAGHAARRLLEFAWSREPRDRLMVIHALQCVCRTFESDQEASAALIRRCLGPSHLEQFGHEEMSWLAREVKRLIRLDPSLVAEIYCVAFKHQETSKETTQMGQSQILPLLSNRRQDYKMALYELGESYPVFLEQASDNATHALISVTEDYIAQRHHASAGEEHEGKFDFNGRQVHIRTDYSSIWDEGDTYRHDAPLKMLDSFQHFLESMAEQPENIKRLHELVELIVTKNQFAVLWRRLLFTGVNRPDILGREIRPLAWAVPILACVDTTTPAGQFIKVVFPMLGDNERERIENAILGIPETVPVDRRDAAEHVRNRLLGCLTESKIVTVEARNLLEKLRVSNSVPANDPPVRRRGGWGITNGDEEYIRDRGEAVETEVDRKIKELERPMREFVTQHINSVPSLLEIEKIIPILQKLHDVLSRTDADGVHPKQCDSAWDCLAESCACIAKTEGLLCNDEAGVFVKKVLLEASHHPEPGYQSGSEAQFDEHTSWGRPAARIEAAEGLVDLARQCNSDEHDVFKAVERLSEDTVPAVRFQIAIRLNALYKTAHDQMWRIIERVCQDEKSREVLQGLLRGPFRQLGGIVPDRIVELTNSIYGRVCDGPGAAKVRKLCIGIFTGLYIWRDQAQCREIVLDIIKKHADHRDEVSHIVAQLENPLTHGPANPPDPEANDVRRRALDLLERILHSALDILRRLDQKNVGIPFDKLSPHEQEAYKSVLQQIDSIAHCIYFASEVNTVKQQSQAAAERALQPELKRFYQETSSMLDELAATGRPSITHRLLEMLEFFVPIDPKGVFLRIGRVVRDGQQGGYEYESLAADLVVRLVERYLAEHRTLLQEDIECRKTLIEVLDIFVMAGWGVARRLTYRLEEIFR